jgi:hypothetical protein
LHLTFLISPDNTFALRKLKRMRHVCAVGFLKENDVDT